MKQFSTILNIILLLAVGYLYFLHFSGNKKNSFTGNTVTKHVDSCLGEPIIAYVDLDSLNSKVDFIKQRKKELEVEQNSIASEYESAYREMENEKNTTTSI